jgi:hypothetical protein
MLPLVAAWKVCHLPLEAAMKDKPLVLVSQQEHEELITQVAGQGGAGCCRRGLSQRQECPLGSPPPGYHWWRIAHQASRQRKRLQQHPQSTGCTFQAVRGGQVGLIYTPGPAGNEALT